MCSFDNDSSFDSARFAWRSRFNAWFFDTFHGYINFVSSDHKNNAFTGMPAGVVLEIGAGTGANFRFLPRGCQLIALEPNEAMHQRLFTNAQRSGVELQLLRASAEVIPLPDNSVDTVIATLVLCTVRDPQGALAEVRRVLRPGGTFRFVEHVAAHPASPRRWLQHIVAMPWAWLFEGCHTHRNTAQVLEATGFRTLKIESRRLRHSIFVPVNSAIWGIATA